MKQNPIDAPEKMRFKEKFSFGILNLNGYMLLINTYLMIFYTDLVGLNPAAVATLFLITRVLDGLNDPVMGYIIDHLPRTKLGRFRGYLLIGTAVCTLNYFLLWFGPAWAPAGKLAIAYVSYVLIGITFDMMQIPNSSLLPAITADQKDRATLSTFKGAFSLFGSLVFGVIPAFILEAMGQTLRSYSIILFAAMAIVLVTTAAGTLGIRERVEPISDEQYKFREIYGILTQRPVFIVMLVTVLFAISTSASNASNMYFFTYVLERVDVMGISSMVAIVGVVPAVLVSGPLVQKFGKKRLMLGVLISSMLCFAMRLLAVTNIPLIYASTLLCSFPVGIYSVILPNIQADNIDYVEYKLNWRAEAGISSLDSFVAKASQGIGGAISGYVLAATGYVANQPQTDLAKFGIVFNVIGLPVIIYIIAILVFGFGYNLNQKKLDEVNETLNQRREAKNSDS